MGFSNALNAMVFEAPPEPTRSPMKAPPPVIVPDVTKLAQDVIKLSDITSDTARQKMLGTAGKAESFFKRP